MDTKRDKIRQYKDTMVPAGVYAIRNQENGRVLVGASMNLDGALNRHRFELERGTHRNRALLADWTALGAEKFSFETLDLVKPRPDPAYNYEAELATLLELWCDECQCFGDKGYNLKTGR